MSFTHEFFLLNDFIFGISVHNSHCNYLKVLFCINIYRAATNNVGIILLQLQIKICSIKNIELIMPLRHLNLEIIIHV